MVEKEWGAALNGPNELSSPSPFAGELAVATTQEGKGKVVLVGGGGEPRTFRGRFVCCTAADGGVWRVSWCWEGAVRCPVQRRAPELEDGA